MVQYWSGETAVCLKSTSDQIQDDRWRQICNQIGIFGGNLANLPARTAASANQKHIWSRDL